MSRDVLAALLLLVLGLAQMAGQVLGSKTLADLGLVSSASPAPKVFSSVDGLETFSTRFRAEFETETGLRSLDFDADLYGRLAGPYNRRNPYGALLAYGPVLAGDARTAPMFWSVARHALCGRRPLLAEVGIETRDVRGPVWIQLEPREGTRRDLQTRFEVRCE
jgi:hypothetical protein